MSISTNYFILLLLMVCTIPGSCKQPTNGAATPAPTGPYRAEVQTDNSAEDQLQIGDYVPAAYEDQDGNLWFGTLGDGLARYDGEKLRYFAVTDGLAGNAVVDIKQDKDGLFWIGTQSGLSTFDGQRFANFHNTVGPAADRISSLLIDSKDRIWVGSWDGVWQFIGGSFIRFELPVPEVEIRSYQSTMNWVTTILEDEAGNIWFGRDGYGACRYDGNSFTHLTVADGLPSNNVQGLQIDHTGRIWIGTRIVEKDHPNSEARIGRGGLSRLDEAGMTNFPGLSGLSQNDVYELYLDSRGKVWVGTIENGVYAFDGEDSANYQQRSIPYAKVDAVPFFGVQSILEDSRGRMWFGCSGGLFRLKEGVIINVTRDGPWD